MDDNIYQLLLTGGAVAVLYAIYLIVKVIFGKKKNENTTDTDYSKQMAQDIGLISENHLNHIESAIREQTSSNDEWHRKQYEILCQIAGKIH